MLAEITLSKGRPASPFASLALYSSDLTASSPLTAYFASLTWGFMLLIFKLRRAVVVDMLREEGGNLKEDGTEGRRRSKYVHSQGGKKSIIYPSMRLLKSAGKKKLEKNRSSNDPTTLHGHQPQSWGCGYPRSRKFSVFSYKNVESHVPDTDIREKQYELEWEERALFQRFCNEDRVPAPLTHDDALC
jgi:hypothetical protein